MSTLAWLAFLIAAAIGAPARYIVDGLVQDHTDGAFPWGTFVVNVSGSLLLGLITGWGLYHGLDPTARIVLGYANFGTEGDGVYEIRQCHAHAWVEALVQRPGGQEATWHWLTLHRATSMRLRGRAA